MLCNSRIALLIFGSQKTHEISELVFCKGGLLLMGWRGRELNIQSLRTTGLVVRIEGQEDSWVVFLALGRGEV